MFKTLLKRKSHGLDVMNLRHANMISQVEIFGHQNRENTGGIMIVCFFNPDGTKIPFEKIEELAHKENISIRSGLQDKYI